MRVMVTGGAGYIGSHTVVRLLAAGHEPVIVDSFVNAKPSVLGRIEQLTGHRVRCHAVDLCDQARTRQVFADSPVDAVVHFAGLKAVGESVVQPLRYWANNLGATFSLLSAMAAHGVGTLVFSSSATVYGAHSPVPMREDAPLAATNPYGQTKVAIEHLLRDVATADPNARIAVLRYFNPVGAHPSGLLGEDPQGTPNNLVPFLAQVAVGRRPVLEIFGDDYPTPDGTCVRDYIHVEDLADGHVAALTALAQRTGVHTWNLGTGSGSSVLEMVRAYERAVGHPLPHRVVGRRAGDIAMSYADPDRARRELGWSATRTIEDMCTDSARWQAQNPQGYPDAVVEPLLP
jgi:UDP-glucose 4-epimerase